MQNFTILVYFSQPLLKGKKKSPEVFMHTPLLSAHYSLIQNAAEPLSPLPNTILIMFLNLCQFQRG